MIFFILFYYFFSGHTINGASIDFKITKPVMCAFNGNKVGTKNPATPVMDPSTIPCGCEIIIFTACNTTGNFVCDTDLLKQVVGLNRTVFVTFNRNYTAWLDTLKPEGNAEDAKAITDYATANGISGVIIWGLIPILTTEDTPSGALAVNVLPYLKQLKINPDFIVSISIDPYSILFFDPSVFNYEASNELLDFYSVHTFEMNVPCRANISNSKTPIHDVENLLSLDYVVSLLNQTKIAVDKIYLVIDLEATDPNNPEFSSYTEVCTTKVDTNNWCIPTTKDYYDKAKFIHDQNFGVSVYWIELDDSQNSCKCDAFIGLRNIVAGYKNETLVPCAKLDIKTSP